MTGLLCTVLLYAHVSLQDAQVDALAISPDVAIARGKVAEAQALYDQARATYGPAVMANYAQSPQAGPTNVSTVEQRLTTVGASWTLGDLFAYAPAIAQANAALQSARLSLNDAERNEQVSVISAYYSALGAQAAQNARTQELAAANAELRAANLRLSAGDAPRLDVVRATVAVASAQADLARAQADTDTAAATLAAETGLPVTSFETTVLSQSEIPPLTTSANDAIQIALTRRPDVAAARENVAAEEHAVGVARRGGWPLVTLTGGYTTGVDTGIHVSGASATVDVSLPVTGAAHERVLAEEARLTQAQAQLAKLERSVRLEVGATVRDYQAQSVALTASQRALQGAQAEFAATQIGYRSGAVSSLDVEAARTTYVQALVNEISALYAQAKARAALNLVLGQPIA
ncbi:MAG TPA: TolC family protein [Candidatus Cybelea sp.]|jgi:outer membrane protein TolC